MVGYTQIFLNTRMFQDVMARAIIDNTNTKMVCNLQDVFDEPIPFILLHFLNGFFNIHFTYPN